MGEFFLLLLSLLLCACCFPMAVVAVVDYGAMDYGVMEMVDWREGDEAFTSISFAILGGFLSAL